MAIDDKSLRDKLAAARTHLILDKPFIGALIMRLPLQEANSEWCKTVATDARSFYYNREYIEALRPHELQFVMAHEAMHCALLHFSRRQNRVRHRWDLACDYAINPILIEEGFQPPPDALYMREYEGMTAEEIYPFIQDNDAAETLDQHLYDQQSDGDGEKGESRQSPANSAAAGQGRDDTNDGSDAAGGSQRGDSETKGRPPPLSEQERQELTSRWQQRVAGAAQQAEQAGKLSGQLSRMLDEMLQPQLPWRMLLARYLSQTARDDYSYSRPSSRRGHPAVFPSLRSQHLNIVVAIDVSGSVRDEEISQFVAEVNALKSALRARITLLLCDSALVGDSPHIFESWQEFNFKAKFPGGGGTDFRPVFEYAQMMDTQPDALLYFTDGRGQTPKLAPTFPVIWLLKGRGKVPWGQRVQLN